MVSNRTNTDAWLERTSAALGLTPEQMASMTIDEIKDKGLAQREAYAIRKLATAEINSAGADQSLSKRILKVLRNGPVDDIGALKSALFFSHEDTHNATDITKAVWSLQKRNLVTFYERKGTHGDSLLTKIKLTKQGMRDQGLVPERDSAKPDKVKGSGELKRPSKVGKDMTDAARHHYIAKGDPVEVVHEGIPAYKPNLNKHGVDMSQPMPVVSRDFPDPLPQNMKPVIDDKKVVRAAPWEGLRDVIRAEFPVLQGILEKADKQAAFVMAAEALDGVDDETAKVLRARVSLTDLEAEVLRLVSRMG